MLVQALTGRVRGPGVALTDWRSRGVGTARSPGGESEWERSEWGGRRYCCCINRLTGPFLTLQSSQAGENALEPTRDNSDQVSIKTQQLEAVTHTPPPQI